MSNTIVSRTLWFIFYVLLQGLVLNHINFLDSINPYLYILFLIKTPANIGRGNLLLIGFALGMCVDVLSSTPGMHASATTLAAYIKPNIDAMFADRDERKNGVVASAKSFGLASYMRYAAVLTILHHLAYFFVCASNIELIFLVLKNTLCSVIFTMLLVFIIESYNDRRNKR